MIEKLWARRADGNRLPESDLNVGELSGSEDVLTADSRGLGDFKGERPRDDAHPEIEGTGFPFYLSEADRIDGQPQYLEGIKKLVHLFA